MISADSRWHERDHHLQTLYVPPVLQQLLPQFLIGDEALPENVIEVIREHDLPRLKVTLSAYYRRAASRFFNLPSARRCLERSLETERAAIAEWIAEETSARYSFDYFGEAGDPLAGYGVAAEDETKLLWTKSIRHVMQRGSDGKPILWTAYPLLSPRHACWMDHYNYASHQPATRLTPLFYYFLSNYLSVAGEYLFVDAALQGSTDFYLNESPADFDALRQTVGRFNHRDMNSRDIAHLRYELRSRCLDESLSPQYLETPEVLIQALQQSLDNLARIRDNA